MTELGRAGGQSSDATLTGLDTLTKVLPCWRGCPESGEGEPLRWGQSSGLETLFPAPAGKAYK